MNRQMDGWSPEFDESQYDYRRRFGGPDQGVVFGKPDPTSLFVTGIPAGLTETSLKKLCQSYGEVVRCFVFAPRGREFTSGKVTFQHQSSADEARIDLDQMEILQNQFLTVSYFKYRIRPNNEHSRYEERHVPVVPFVPRTQSAGRGRQIAIKSNLYHPNRGVTEFSRDLPGTSQRVQQDFNREPVSNINYSVSPNEKYFKKEKRRPRDDVCENCDQPGYLKRCTKCRKVFYCSRECQLEDWPRHSRRCQSDDDEDHEYAYFEENDVQRYGESSKIGIPGQFDNVTRNFKNQHYVENNEPERCAEVSRNNIRGRNDDVPRKQNIQQYVDDVHIERHVDTSRRMAYGQFDVPREHNMQPYEELEYDEMNARSQQQNPRKQLGSSQHKRELQQRLDISRNKQSQVQETAPKHQIHPRNAKVQENKHRVSSENLSSANSVDKQRISMPKHVKSPPKHVKSPPKHVKSPPKHVKSPPKYKDLFAFDEPRHQTMEVKYKPMLFKDLEKLVLPSGVVQLTYVDGPNWSSFSVQLSANMGCIEQLRSKINSHCSKISTTTTSVELKVGEIWGAQWQQEWYRSYIVKFESADKVMVKFIDYGNSDVVPIANLRRLSPDLASLPPQAILCRLNWVKTSDGQWCKGAIKVFAKVICKDFFGQFGKQNIYIPDCYHVDIYPTKSAEYSMANVLVEKGFATLIRSIQSPNNSMKPQQSHAQTEPSRQLFDQNNSMKPQQSHAQTEPSRQLFDQNEPPRNSFGQKQQPRSSPFGNISAQDQQAKTSLPFNQKEPSRNSFGRSQQPESSPTSANSFGEKQRPISSSPFSQTEPSRNTFGTKYETKSPSFSAQHESPSTPQIKQNPRPIVPELGAAEVEPSTSVGPRCLSPISPIMDTSKNGEVVPEERNDLKCVLDYIEVDETISLLIMVENQSEIWAISSQEIVELQEQLENHYGTVESPNYSPSKGEIVAAKSKTDNAWYRARVLRKNPTSTVVFYVDFGNNEQVDIVSKIDPQFLKKPAYAIRCSTDGTTNCRLVQNESYEGTVESKTDDIIVVSCNVDGISSKITCSGSIVMAMNIPDLELESGATYSVLVTNVFDLQEVVFMKQDQIQDLMDLTAKFDGYCSKVSGDSYEAVTNEVVFGKFEQSWYRAHILMITEDGTYKVQYVDYGNISDLASKDLRRLPWEYAVIPRLTACGALPLDDLTVTPEMSAYLTDCIMKLTVKKKSEDVILISMTDESGANVEDRLQELAKPSTDQVVNSGSNKSIEESDIQTKAIESEVPDLEALSINDCLPPLEEPVRSRPSDIEPSDPIQFLHMLTDCVTLKPDMNKEINMIVLSAVSPDIIHCTIPNEDTEKLDDLNLEITNYCNSLPNSSYEPLKGEVCFARFADDDTWYRAVMMDCDDAMASILFLDFGNFDVVPISDIRKIQNDKFLRIPFQAFSCKLNGVDSIDEFWPEDIQEQMKNCIGFDTLRSGKVLRIDEESNFYVVDFPEIRDSLVKANLARIS